MLAATGYVRMEIEISAMDIVEGTFKAKNTQDKIP